MKIAITGANGLFGHVLVQVVGAAHSTLPMTRADADLIRLPDVRGLLLRERPDALIHTAAAPDPDACERNPKYALEELKTGISRPFAEAFRAMIAWGR